MAVLGCGRAASPGSGPTDLDATTSGSSGLSQAREVAGKLEAAGVLTGPQALGLLRVSAGKDLWGVFVTPGAPGADQAIEVVVLAPDGLVEMPSTGAVRWSADGWSHQADAPGEKFAATPLRGLVFTLGARGSPGSIDFAVALQFGGATVWLNREGANYHLEVLGQRRLDYVGGLTAQQGGVLRQLTADPLFAEHEVEFSVETYPPSSDVQPVLHWRGQRGEGAAPMGLSSVEAGPYRQNAQWTASVPPSQLRAEQTLEFWVEAKGPLNTLWDSQEGANHRMPVAVAPAPSWAELGAYSFTKCHPSGGGSCQVGWFYGSGLTEPFQATPAEYQVYAAAPSIAVEVYVPGVTDVGVLGPEGAPSFVRAEIFSPFFSGRPSGSWSGYPLRFAERAGNNWRLRWDVRSFSIPFSPPIGVDCAVNGDYPFKVRLSTDGGNRWQWLGQQGLPFGGDNRTMRWENQSAPPALSVSGSTQLPLTAVGHFATRRIELVNTTGMAVVMTGLAVQGAAFSALVSGCPTLATCNRTLQSGERFPIDLRFAPSSPGVAQGQLQLFEHAEGDVCYQAGRLDVGLTGTGR